MNFERDFLNSIAYKKFKRALGRDDALEYIFRLWATCEAQKSKKIVLTDVEDLALLMDAPQEIDGKFILDAFIKSGLLVEVGSSNYEAVIWADHNASLLSRWENGRKGGRPKEGNVSKEKEIKEIKKKRTKPNESEEKQSEPNVRKETKARKVKESKVKGPVSRKLTEEEPNYNQRETEKKQFVPYDWGEVSA